MVAEGNHGSMQRFHFFDGKFLGIISERVDRQAYGILKVCSRSTRRITRVSDRACGSDCCADMHVSYYADMRRREIQLSLGLAKGWKILCHPSQPLRQRFPRCSPSIP